MPKLPFSFYQNEDVVRLSRMLLGKQLFTKIDGVLTGGTIVETEAYMGVIDKASHAYGGRFTNRTQTMYNHGGVSYIYLCYGIHHLFNVVTAPQGTPHAVLIRGLEPTTGIDEMLLRRDKTSLKSNLTAGPGALAQALGLNRNFNNKELTGDEVWIEDNGVVYADPQIVAGPRIGVSYAEDHALLPYRFYVKGNKYVSKPNS